MVNGIAAARADRRAGEGWWAFGIYGGILRFARGQARVSMIRKSGNQFSEKIMFKQRDEIMIRLNLVGS
jgi:hypothetical protein